MCTAESKPVWAVVFRAATVGVLCLGFVAPGAARDLTPGIIGADDRVPVDVATAPWSAVGQVNVARYRRRTSCSGTLVAPDRVLTAAHCVLDPIKGALFPRERIHFLVGVFGSRYAAHAQPKCVLVPGELDKEAATATTGNRAPGSRGLAWFANDVAVLVLEKPLAAAPVDIAEIAASGLATAPLIHAAYAGDRRQRLTAHRGCAVRGASDGLLLTDCDTHYAGSGGPVLVERDGTFRLAAVMVAVLSGRASVAVPAARWRRLALEQQCSAD